MPPPFIFPNEIHIHVHSDHADHEGAKGAILAAIQELRGEIMAKFNDVQALLAAIDADSNTTAANIQVLIDRINATPGDGLDGPQTEAVLTALATLRDRMSALAANSQNPIPPPLPEVPVL